MLSRHNKKEIHHQWAWSMWFYAVISCERRWVANKTTTMLSSHWSEWHLKSSEWTTKKNVPKKIRCGFGFFKTLAICSMNRAKHQTMEHGNLWMEMMSLIYTPFTTANDFICRIFIWHTQCLRIIFVGYRQKNTLLSHGIFWHGRITRWDKQPKKNVRFFMKMKAIKRTAKYLLIVCNIKTAVAYQSTAREMCVFSLFCI